MTLAEVRTAYGPGGYCSLDFAPLMLALIDECEPLLAGQLFSFGIGLGCLYIFTEPSRSPRLQIEVFFDGPKDHRGRLAGELG
ncbi:MAG TPA: hypothetical protein VN688_14175 [Gemmataceae bacterium]|nr:hypothetical protein [Gemmataceae bacterium]